MITWLTTDNERYLANQALSPSDIGVPGYPEDGKSYQFNRDTWQWEPIPPTVTEQIQAIQNEYRPQFVLLQNALNGAVMYDDTQDIADIKEEYKTLVAEMDAKIEEVQNGSQ